MIFEQWLIEKAPTLKPSSIQTVLKLASEGATVPFMARYRKEQTGALDEVAIQLILDKKETWDSLIKRKDFVLDEINKQGKLTDALKNRITACYNPLELEDLYLPYKQKRKTKAMKAKEAGLEPLALDLWAIGHGEKSAPQAKTLEQLFEEAAGTKDYETAELVEKGVQSILTEKLSEDQSLRDQVRKTLSRKAFVKAKKSDKATPNSKFEKYFDYEEPLTNLKDPKNSHRYLALKRAWHENEIQLSLGASSQDESNYEDQLLKAFEQAACPVESIASPVLKMSARLALKVYVLTSIEKEIHSELKAIADEAAIQVFAENVRKLLLAAPFGSKGVLAIDPGLRTGCKVALIDASGKYLANTVIYPHETHKQTEAEQVILKSLSAQPLKAIAVGNGTAGRETEDFVRKVLAKNNIKIPVVSVNESGASIYSASEAAREEFPNLDITVRGAISIGRRLQDPLAELVKIDPKSIGVGQYQHDVSQPDLKKSLNTVVDSCVNSVGIDVNTASYHLLSRVSGVGPALAKTIVKFRDDKGLFKSRQDLLKVPRFTEKTFEQAAGFLRVRQSQNPLDNTGVHPERYSVIENFAKKNGFKIEQLLGGGVSHLKTSKEFAKEVGEYTFKDIINELEQPGRDPREEFVTFSFRDDIHEVSDLKEGMTCPGIVTNVTNFGAFVDIGVHQDGLVHISQLADRFVKDPNDVVSPGDKVSVRVMTVDLNKRQIALTMKSGEIEKDFRINSSKSKSRQNYQKTERQPKKEFTNNPFAALGKR